MKKIVIGSVIILIILIGIIVSINLFNKNNNEIPDGYIAVFNGGSGEITYSTYIYKINNGRANYGFEYINTTNITKSWGSSEWITTVTGRGKVDWTDDVFSIAEKNGAYSYVMLPNSNKIYSIEEYMNMFLMN